MCLLSISIFFSTRRVKFFLWRVFPSICKKQLTKFMLKATETSKKHVN